MALAKGAGTARSSRSVFSTAAKGVARKTAVLCSVAALIGSFATPAYAAPATGVSMQPVMMPAAPALPSAEEIAAAKSNEEASARQVAKIEQILEAAVTAQQATFTLSMQANNAYGDALVEFQGRQAAAELAASRAEAAQAKQATTRKEVGQLAGDLYRNGGLNPSLGTFMSGNGDALHQAATLEAISANRSRAFESAETAASAAVSLTATAAETRRAADEAAATAAIRKTQAEEANAAQAKAVADAQAQRTVLIDQLATLRNTTVELESERISGLEKQREEARMARLLADAGKAAAEQAARDAAQNDKTDNKPAPAPVPARPAPAPAVPAPNPPAPPAPPAPAPPAPAPPAPAPEPAPAPAPPPPPPAPAPPAPPPPPAPAPDGSNQTAVSVALSKVGAPHYYQWGGTGPYGFDCSGLVFTSFAAAGKSLPRTATPQYTYAPTKVPLSQAQPGDLLFWGSEGNFYHVAIYLGGGRVVQALNPSEGIDVTELRWMMGPPYHYAARY